MSVARSSRSLLGTTLLAVLLAACSPSGDPEGAAKAPAAVAETAVAYISNQDGDISVVSLDNFEVIGSIDPGEGEPRGIGISDDGKWLVTANRGTGDLSIIDRASGEVSKRVEIGENPEFVRVRGQLAFVSFEPEAEGGPPPKPGTPEYEALQKEREEDEDSEPAEIAVVDLDTGEVIRNIIGGIETEGIEFSTDGEHILITNEADNTITVHRIADGEQVKSIDTSPIGPRPRGIKRAPDGKTYVASIEFGNQLMVLDEEFDPIKAVPTGKVPYGLTFDRSGTRVYVALAHGNALQVFDAATFKEVGQASTGKRCWHFSFTPDDAHIIVTCGRSHEAVVIDANTLKEVSRIGDLKMPWGIVTWPKAPGTLDWPTN